MHPDPQPPTPVVATLTGADLLSELKEVTKAVQTLAIKLDDIPSHVDDLEQRMRVQEGRRCVTWPQLAAVLTLICAVATVAAAFLTIH